MGDFVHLHLHSEYSLLDGACRIRDIPKHVKALGQDSVAITDHGCLYGAVDFYKACKAEGVHPIIGCEVYVAPRSRFDKVHKVDSSPYHLVLLCKNEEGYQNLIRLVSKANLEGFYNKPRVDRELLQAHGGGLIALSACLAGEIPRKLSSGDYEGAKETALFYQGLFGQGNYYLEVQNHGIDEQKKILPLLRRLSMETGIPLAATNDCHYTVREDAKMQSILTCIQTGQVYGGNSLEFPTSEFYMKSREEMASALPGFEDALDNTLAIARQCQFDFTFGVTKLPHFSAPDGRENLEYFLSLCREGLIRRYGQPSEGLTRRLDYEIDTIVQMGYVDYFLIVYDFIRYAKSVGIPVGPGRGSGAGSLAAYCMGITEVDPIKYQLIFERFLNPERVSMPDFDIDFCDERRQEVIDYVVRKYGSDHVAQIITFGTMAARAAVRDVARAMGLSYQTGDKVAKLIPYRLKMTVDKALKESRELKRLYDTDHTVHELLEMAKKVEGMPRHASTHAAGVVITAAAVECYVPLQKSDDSVITQYPMTTLEELGLLKMDFLGLRTLTVIDHTVKAVQKFDPGFSIEKIPLDDKKVFELFSKGNTSGIFQFESAGMRQVLTQVKPRSIEDLTAITSLYRPGPADSIPTYIKNRFSPTGVTYLTPLLEPILKVTNGCLIYQEQVMEVFRKLAGYSYGRADLVRRAMAKKKADVMEAERHNFIYGLQREDGSWECVGAVANGVPAETANRLFDEMASFASYAFNKSHAAAYSIVSYQTAYLKCYYPKEYMAAHLTSVVFATGKLMEYINECKSLGIPVLPPDVNQSCGEFLAVKEGLRFGLLGVKGLGRSAIQSLVEERKKNGPYQDFFDFCKRLYGKDLNRRGVEGLIHSGAMDCFGQTRRALFLSCDRMLEAAAFAGKNDAAGQMDLFSAAAIEEPKPQLAAADEYPLNELLRHEYEALGMYVSSHPLKRYEKLIESLKTDSISQIIAGGEERYPDRKPVRLFGTVAHKKLTRTKKGQGMCFITFEDMTGSIEGVLFPEVYSRCERPLLSGDPVLLEGTISQKEEETPSVLVNGLTELSALKSKEQTPQTVFIKLPSQQDSRLKKVMDIIKACPGESEVRLYFSDQKKYCYPAGRPKVNPDEAFLKSLAFLIPREDIALK